MGPGSEHRVQLQPGPAGPVPFHAHKHVRLGEPVPCAPVKGGRRQSDRMQKLLILLTVQVADGFPAEFNKDSNSTKHSGQTPLTKNAVRVAPAFDLGLCQMPDARRGWESMMTSRLKAPVFVVVSVD
jgi:hypothetical protein